MSNFMSNLWDSVFTAGTTPTLLLATNATFGLLQILLIALLIATYSIHFAILSVLCGGLWWSINWFARELIAAQAKEAEAEKLRQRKKDRGGEWRRRGEVEDSADDEGEDTEVEGDGGRLASVGDEDARVREEIRQAMNQAAGTTGGGDATGVEQAAGGAEVRQRKVEDADRSGEVSTDSEWERVSQEGDR